MRFVHKSPAVSAIAATALTALCLYFGNGLHPVWPLMWVAFLPVLFFAANSSSLVLTGACASCAMLLGSLPMLGYLHGTLAAPVSAWLIPFSIASVLFALGVLLFRALLRRGAFLPSVISLPAFWTLCEFLNSFDPSAGTAGSLAYTQLRCLPVLQIASVTGLWGITFLLLWFQCAIVAFTRNRRVAFGSMAALAAVILFGAVRLALPQTTQTMKVALLATDTVRLADPGAPVNLLIQNYTREARNLAEQGARIVVMPEMSGVLLDQSATTLDPVLQSAADDTGATLVIGFVHVVPPSTFNEARIYQPHAPITAYHKQHLLPPFESKETPGSTLTILRSPAGPIATAICKDMDFVRPALDYGRAGTSLLLDPAWDFTVDDLWHGHIAIMRGVENGYAIAHTAKHGFLTVTDDRGRVLAEISSNKAPFAALLVDVPVHHDNTIFSRFGNWFPLASALIVLYSAACLWPRKNSSATFPTPDKSATLEARPRPVL